MYISPHDLKTIDPAGPLQEKKKKYTIYCPYCPGKINLATPLFIKNNIKHKDRVKPLTDDDGDNNDDCGGVCRYDDDTGGGGGYDDDNGGGGGYDDDNGGGNGDGGEDEDYNIRGCYEL